MAHLVSSNREQLLEAGRILGMSARWLQYKPLKNPDTGARIEAWHWDLRGHFLERGTRSAKLRTRSGENAATGREE
jgi:hypothetical protein